MWLHIFVCVLFSKYFIVNGNIDESTTEILLNQSTDNDINKSLRENSIFYGVLSESIISQNGISRRCKKDLKSIFNGINNRDLWALKVMDASGNVRNSFVWGQNSWLGSEDQCNFLNEPPTLNFAPELLAKRKMDRQLISTKSLMELEYKIIFSNVTSTYQIDSMIHLPRLNTIGLCLPLSCSNRDVKFLTQTYFNKNEMNFQKLFKANIDIVSVRNMDMNNFLSLPEVYWIFIAIVFCFIGVVFFSFLYDVFEPSSWEKTKTFFYCFSISRNMSSVYETSSSPSAIKSINGIRSLICIWVLFIHMGYFTLFSYDNLGIIFQKLELWWVQPLFAIVVYVDIFFTLSAIVLVYNFLKDEETLRQIRESSFLDNLKLFLKKIIHRYLRLTPALLFTIGVSHLLALYLQETSAHYVNDRFDLYCSRFGLINSIFYIENLFPVNHLCIAWSWYLACDMQFYIVVVFCLFVYARYPNLIKNFYFLMFVVLTVLAMLTTISSGVTPTVDALFYYISLYYTQPWMRMHPYLAGILIGYIMFVLKDKKINLHGGFVGAYWFAAVPIFFLSLFVTIYHDNCDNFTFGLAMTIGRYLLGIFIGSVVVFCHLGYGGILDRVLGSRIFVHINKISYLIYLLHPIFITYMRMVQDQAAHFDVVSLISSLFSVTLLSYFGSVLVAPFFEIPFQRISDEYVMKKTKAKSYNNNNK